MKLLDVIAVLEDLPKQALYRGQVGTIVEEYEQGFLKLNLAMRQVKLTP